MSIIKKWCYCIIPLIIGGLIYIGFRKKSLLMFKWFEYIKIMKFIDLFRESIKDIKLPNFLIDSLPNGLWVFSFLVFINITTKNITRKILILFVIFIAFGFEFAQLVEVIPGIFCWKDVLTNIFFIALGLKINKKMRTENERI